MFFTEVPLFYRKAVLSYSAMPTPQRANPTESKLLALSIDYLYV
jgi:hypothetical protein